MQPEISQYIAKHPFAKFHPGSHPLTMFFQNDDILKKKKRYDCKYCPMALFIDGRQCCSQVPEM